MKQEKRIPLILLLFLLGEIASVNAEEEKPLDEYCEIRFDEVRIYMVYVFDISLLEEPIGVDNLPVDLRNITGKNESEKYFQDQVDSRKLESLYNKIKEEISKNDIYSFVYLEDFDRNRIVLVHKSYENIKFCYDGLIFWIEITHRDFDMSDPIKNGDSRISFPFPENFDLAERDLIIELFRSSLSDYLPPVPLIDDKNNKASERYVYYYYRDFKIIWLSSSFRVSKNTECEKEREELETEYETYNYHGDLKDTECEKVIGELETEYKTHYEFLVTIGSIFDIYNPYFNDLTLLMNIRRVLREFEIPLKDYRNLPEVWEFCKIIYNLEELDKMTAFVSSAKYAINGLEIRSKEPYKNIGVWAKYVKNGTEEGSRYPTSIPTDISFAVYLAETREDISVARDDIENHISRNEHIQILFTIFLAIASLVASICLSLCISKRTSKKIEEELSVLQRSFLQKTDSINREMRIHMKKLEKTQNDMHRRRKFESKYKRDS